MSSKGICKSTIFFLAILSVALISPPLHAEQPTEVSAAAQANNPLANMTAFNLQNYYIGELAESDDDANQFWLPYAQPFKVSKSSIEAKHCLVVLIRSPDAKLRGIGGQKFTVEPI